MSSNCSFLFLGTGGSMGVPVIGCTCPVCTSNDPHNKRYRPSGLMVVDNRNFLFDCGPDFRSQALHYKINKLDGIFLTHAHNDHTAGIDELRIYSLRSHRPLPCLLSQETLKDLQARFYYIFDKESPYAKLSAKFDLHILTDERGMVDFEGLKVRYMTYLQAGMKVNGYKIGNFAYLTDIKEYPETLFEDLKGTEVLVLSSLRFTPSYLHFDVDEAVAFANRVGAKEVWLTHIAHELEHEKTNAYLPSNVKLAYDGLQINFSC